MTNEILAHHVLQEVLKKGIFEFCVCPGARNSPFVHVLNENKQIKKYFWFEERSAAFFALGRAKQSRQAIAVITTSGTAVGELLPAAMEAYYEGIPLLLISADRPRRFRGSGAPQSAEQVGIFGIYAPFQCDLESGEELSLLTWSKSSPAHLNVCFEEPTVAINLALAPLELNEREENQISFSKTIYQREIAEIESFLEHAQYPLVVVGDLPLSARAGVAAFLSKLNLPVYLEGISGLRENSHLRHLRIIRSDHICQNAAQNGYPIDGILRIGGIPTFRLWRDLEDQKTPIKVCSISAQPFSGLSWGDVQNVCLTNFFHIYSASKTFALATSQQWRRSDSNFGQALLALFLEEPQAEPALIYNLSLLIPAYARIYLGNSLPIREWDLAACNENKEFIMEASRGLNGIDGQISTFLGFSQPGQENWAILGDLTTLYDMAGPWILPQLDLHVNLVVVNNGGGQIFSRMFPNKEFLNEHQLCFNPLANMWGMKYEKWHSIPSSISSGENKMIELIPCAAATDRFWKKFTQL